MKDPKGMLKRKKLSRGKYAKIEEMQLYGT